MFKFALNINDDQSTLSPNDGLDIGELSILTAHLNKAINGNKKEKCTLSAIENHGYTPNFTTGSQNIYTKFVQVHKDIQEKGLTDLNKNEANYAIALKRILGNNKYIEPIDSNQKALFRLTSKDIDTTADNYSVITTQSGIVSEIGSPKLEDNRHVYLHNLDYKIYITSAQEEILKEQYRKDVVELKLKQKRSIKSGRILSATLISLKVKPQITLSESLSDLSDEDLDVFPKIKTLNDILTIIRQ